MKSSEIYGRTEIYLIENKQKPIMGEETVKNIEWAKSQIELRDTGTTDTEDPQFYVNVGLKMALDFLNQIDELVAYKDGYKSGIELMEVMNMVYEDGEFWENEKMKKCIEWLKEEEYSNRKDLEE